MLHSRKFRVFLLSFSVRLRYCDAKSIERNKDLMSRDTSSHKFSSELGL